jgi:2-keto-4-pentenoate hydratase/2-oxohepta-3-ene-1,7-dioic acid hydratase in catechol pathway
MLNAAGGEWEAMRLCSFRDGDGGERLAVVVDGHAAAADELTRDGPRTMGQLLASAPPVYDRLRGVAATDVARIGLPLDELTLLPPVPRPAKVVAIGRNYKDHAAESGTQPPSAPLIFAKFTTAVIGHGDQICWSESVTKQVDYEAELGVVIGRTARNVDESTALDYVLGYTCVDDVSARDLQFGDGQWTRGKSLDSFCPIGPIVVSGDEIGDANDLAIHCFVNGEKRQSARTSDLYFGVAEIISHCSRAFTLEPGDVIATGTPAGVGAFRDPPLWLADGDEVVVEIDGIGRLVNRCRVTA